MSGFEKLYSRLNFSFGVNTKCGPIEKYQQRIKNMKKKFQETVKMKKKNLRAVRKRYIDKEKDNKGEGLYITESFQCDLLCFMFMPIFILCKNRCMS